MDKAITLKQVLFAAAGLLAAAVTWVLWNDHQTLQVDTQHIEDLHRFFMQMSR